MCPTLLHPSTPISLTPTDGSLHTPHSQLQYSLLDARPENGTAAFCAANGISLLPYGVVAGGFLSDKYLGVPISRWEVWMRGADACGEVSEEAEDESASECKWRCGRMPMGR